MLMVEGNNKNIKITSVITFYFVISFCLKGIGHAILGNFV